MLPAVRDLALTIGLELPALLVLAIRFRLRLVPALAALVAVNLLTQPLFRLWLRRAAAGGEQDWWWFVLAGEAAVWMVEALLYAALLRRDLTVRRALLLSAAANGCSLAIGLLLPV